MQEYRNEQHGPTDYSHRNYAYAMVGATGAGLCADFTVQSESGVDLSRSPNEF